MCKVLLFPDIETICDVHVDRVCKAKIHARYKTRYGAIADVGRSGSDSSSSLKQIAQELHPSKIRREGEGHRLR